MNRHKLSKTSPAQFLQEVRQEATKVTWPTRKETGISTAMVFVFVILAAIFFMIIDQLLQAGVKFIFGFGG